MGVCRGKVDGGRRQSGEADSGGGPEDKVLQGWGVRRAVRGCEGWRGFRQQQLVSNRESKGGSSVCKKQRLTETCKSPQRTMTAAFQHPQRLGCHLSAPAHSTGPSSVPCFALSHSCWFGSSPLSGAVSTWGTLSPPHPDGPDSCGLSVHKLMPDARVSSPVRVESGPVQSGPWLLLCVTDVASGIDH